MKLARVVEIASTAVMLVLALLFLPQLSDPGSALYREVLTPKVLLFTTAPLKILFLALAAFLASSSCAFFEKSNPARRAWLMLAAGLWAYVAAQSVLAFYQLIQETTAPFPSLADLFFVPATVLVAVSLFRFVAVYKEVGFRVAEAGDVRMVAILAGALLVVFFSVVAAPVLASSAPLSERALNVAYPVLDCALLIPAVLLLRMALSMRGGAFWKVWVALLSGFVFLSAGDILFAFFTTLGKSSLDPLIDLMFAWSYVLIAKALATHHGILSQTSAAG